MPGQSNADVRAALTRGWDSHRQGRLDEAKAIYRAALEIAPENADALHLLGIAEAQQNNLETAIDCITRSIALNPANAEAFFNRANAMRILKRFDAAILDYNKALTLNPKHVSALTYRGLSMAELNRYEGALASFDRALALAPENPISHFYRASTLVRMQRHRDALESFTRDLDLNPGRAESLYGQAVCLQSLKRSDEAVESCRRLLALYPDAPLALGIILMSKLESCSWDGLEALITQVIEGVRKGKLTAMPFTILGISDSPEDCLAAARITPASTNVAAPMWTGKSNPHAKIRIAYVSADFYSHATAYLMAGLFEHHDKKRFEIVAISTGPRDESQTRNRLIAAFDRFVDVANMDDAQVAALMREQEIDIAVDLKGYTTGYRTGIFERRPAPIQVNYLGFPGTMGVDYIDYLIADRVIVPEAHQPFYSEKIVYLPDSYQCTDDKRVVPETELTRSEAGLPEDGFVFCCFNNNYKIRPQMFDIWMRLLRQVENSVLWVLEDNPEAVRNMRREAALRGVAEARIVGAYRLGAEYHMARQRLADLFLDTLPYNAHTTASDALWVGLPVLTCTGNAFAGRVATSLLLATGLPELVTDSLESYEAMALKLAREPSLLAGIKEKLARQRRTHPLFDTARFTRHLEAAYTQMWLRHQRGELPASFAVPAESATGKQDL